MDIHINWYRFCKFTKNFNVLEQTQTIVEPDEWNLVSTIKKRVGLICRVRFISYEVIHYICYTQSGKEGGGSLWKFSDYVIEKLWERKLSFQIREFSEVLRCVIFCTIKLWMLQVIIRENMKVGTCEEYWLNNTLTADSHKLNTSSSYLNLSLQLAKAARSTIVVIMCECEHDCVYMSKIRNFLKLLFNRRLPTQHITYCRNARQRSNFWHRGQIFFNENDNIIYNNHDFTTTNVRLRIVFARKMLTLLWNEVRKSYIEATVLELKFREEVRPVYLCFRWLPPGFQTHLLFIRLKHS